MKRKLNWREFIKFWSQFYDDSKHPDEEFYYPYINDLSKKDSLNKLWLWKMDCRFYRIHHRKVVLINKSKDIIINFRNFKPRFEDLCNFSRKIFSTGIVYQVFLMHICRPEEYPIFDQHVFRAFIFLTRKKIVDIPKDIQDYLNYRKFVFQIQKKYKIKLRDIDKALMAFGQFLNNPQKFLKINYK
jgi:hypothetical protein